MPGPRQNLSASVTRSTNCSSPTSVPDAAKTTICEGSSTSSVSMTVPPACKRRRSDSSSCSRAEIAASAPLVASTGEWILGLTTINKLRKTVEAVAVRRAPSALRSICRRHRVIRATLSPGAIRRPRFRTTRTTNGRGVRKRARHIATRYRESSAICRFRPTVRPDSGQPSCTASRGDY
jgi:hypothetical protein